MQPGAGPSLLTMRTLLLSLLGTTSLCLPLLLGAQSPAPAAMATHAEVRPSPPVLLPSEIETLMASCLNGTPALTEAEKRMLAAHHPAPVAHTGREPSAAPSAFPDALPVREVAASPANRNAAQHPWGPEVLRTILPEQPRASIFPSMLALPAGDCANGSRAPRFAPRTGFAQ